MTPSLSADFVTPPGMWGSGVASRFLQKLCTKLHEERGVRRFNVTLRKPEDKSEAGRLQETSDLIDFYMREGFTQMPGGESLELWI